MEENYIRFEDQENLDNKNDEDKNDEDNNSHNDIFMPDNSVFIENQLINQMIINDNFLIKVYNYYHGRGFTCILIDDILNLFGLLFIILYCVFLFECIDYKLLFENNSLFESTKLSNIKHISFFTILCIILVSFVFLYKMLRVIEKTKQNIKIKEWYEEHLDIDHEKILTIKWSNIMDKLLIICNNQVFQPTITKLDIVNRIMRKNNYFIAMVDLNILSLDLNIPCYGKYMFLSKYFEWTLHKCIFNYFFDSNSQLKKQFITDANTILHGNDIAKFKEELKNRFKTMTIINVFCLPFILLFQLTYFFFKYAEEYRREPYLLGLRQYSHYSRWKFREYNELPHIFENRLNMSYDDACKYISHFSNKITQMVKEFIVFIASSFLVFLTIVSIIDEDVLFNDVTYRRSVLWYIGLFGGIIGICKLSKKNEFIYKPDKLLKRVAIYTHYYPNEWKNNEHLQIVYEDFSHYFQIKVYSLLEELLSFIITPYMLYFKLYSDTDKIIDFFISYTIYNQNIGYMCSFANMQTNNNIPEENQNKIRNSNISFEFNYNQPERNSEEPLNTLSLIKEDKMKNNSVLSLGLSILQLDDEQDNNEITINIHN